VAFAQAASMAGYFGCLNELWDCEVECAAGMIKVVAAAIRLHGGHYD
jgi:hypothetical protein